jgi:hypothetical protein
MKYRKLVLIFKIPNQFALPSTYCVVLLLKPLHIVSIAICRKEEE